MTHPRHSWSPPYRKADRTERVCLHCGIMKVTRHEPAALPWIEFHMRGRRVDAGNRTPKCEARQ